MKEMKEAFSVIVYGRRRKLKGKYNQKNTRRPGFESELCHPLAV